MRRVCKLEKKWQELLDSSVSARLMRLVVNLDNELEANGRSDFLSKVVFSDWELKTLPITSDWTSLHRNDAGDRLPPLKAAKQIKILWPPLSLCPVLDTWELGLGLEAPESPILLNSHEAWDYGSILGEGKYKSWRLKLNKNRIGS